MAAVIRSTVGGFVVTGASRDYSDPGPPQVDLAVGDIVTVESVGAGATTFAWSLAYIPEGSNAVFSTTGTPTATTAAPGTFEIDEEGPYLLRLMTDAGLGTEDEQFVRIRCLTAFGDLKLVAAGERYDGPAVPVDITTAGWADEQNFNLLTLLGFVKTASASGRVLYVDPVSGDYNTIQEAMDAANLESPTNAAPWLVLVRPGVYTEDLLFYPAVHVYGWPGNEPAYAEDGIGERVVVIRNNTVQAHRVWLDGSGDVTISNLFFEQLSATINPVIDVQTPASDRAFFNRCTVIANGTDAAQGPAIKVSNNISVGISDCRLEMNPAAGVGQPVLLAESNAAVEVVRSILVGRSGVNNAAGGECLLRDCTIEVDGTYGARATGSVGIADSSLILVYCNIKTGPTTAIEANPTAAVVAGDLSVSVRWSYIGGDITFDPTNVGGNTSLLLGSSEHGTVTVVAPLTTQAAITPSDTLFYDNTTTGITAADVQAALDEIYTYASQVRTLDDAYDGGTPGPTGTGRTIYADAGAVQIMDANPPVGPVDKPGNTDGRLQVSSSVEIGSVTSPEINLDPNPFGIGPEIILGEEVWAGDALYGSTAYIRANSTQKGLFPTWQNYNLGLSTIPTIGGGVAVQKVGSVVVRGGVGLDTGAATNPAAGDVHVLGGEATATANAAAHGGSVYIAPGESVSGTTGSIFLGRAQTATAATVTAVGPAVLPPGGVESVTIGTDIGAFTVTFGAADLLPAVLVALSASGYVDATEAAGVITLTAITKGPASEVFWVSGSVAINTALGDLLGGTKVAGTWPSQMEVVVSAANEITFGPSGATGPLVYNADTGKLTVPGLIDPTGVVFDEAALPFPVVSPNKGAVFVSNGSGGLDLNHLYYEFADTSTVKLSGGGGGGGTLQDAYNAGNTITTSGATHIDFTLSTAGGGFLVDGAVADEGFAGFGSATRLLAFTVEAQAMALNSTQGASFIGGANTDFRMNATDAATRTLLVSATNAGAGAADLTIDAEDQITVGGTNTLAPIIKVAGGANAEILNLSQTTGESFGLFAGTADPNGSVSASAGSLFVRDTGAGASIYQNRSTGTGTVWTELSGTGDVVGPGSSTDNALARFHLLTGKEVQNSVGLLTDAGALSGLTKVTTTDLAVATLTVPVVGQVLQAADVAGNVGWVDRVSGPGSSTDEAIARFDAATGNLLQNSTATLTDAGLLTATDVTATAGLVGATLQVTSGAVLDHVLTSDGSGNATWAAPAGSTDTVKVDFLYSDASPVTIATLNTGDVLLNIWIRYDVVFNNPAATTTMEVVSPALTVVGVTDTGAASVPDAWSFNPVYAHTAAATTLTLTLQPAGSTAGSGFVVAMIHRA